MRGSCVAIIEKDSDFAGPLVVDVEAVVSVILTTS